MVSKSEHMFLNLECLQLELECIISLGLQGFPLVHVFRIGVHAFDFGMHVVVGWSAWFWR